MELSSCNFCDIINAIDHFTIFKDDEVDSILYDIFRGDTTTHKLSKVVYDKIATKLFNGVEEGYGKALAEIKLGTPDYNMLFSLKENTYIFSAAKTYQQTSEISKLLVDADGKRRSFYDFNKEAKKVFDTYNKDYLYAEYNTAIATSRAASFWKDIEADSDVYNQLKYQTVNDARVRPEHKVLDNIVRPIQDPFWSYYYPPNGFNCRCTVIQVMDEPNTKLKTRIPPTDKEVPEAFRFNAGKDKIVFSKKHPYFDVPKEDKPLAKRNFDLPLPDANRK